MGILDRVFDLLSQSSAEDGEKKSETHDSARDETPPLSATTDTHQNSKDTSENTPQSSKEQEQTETEGSDANPEESEQEEKEPIEDESLTDIDGVGGAMAEETSSKSSEDTDRSTSSAVATSTSTFATLTQFQRDLLIVVAGMDTPKGLTIKDEIEQYYGEEIHHGRLYPNLDTLADNGFIEKTELSERANGYVLTEFGKAHLKARREWEDHRIAAAEPEADRSTTATTTGGDQASGTISHPVEDPSREDLIDAIQQLGEEVEGTPSTIEMQEKGPYSTTVFYNKFDSWNDAVAAAGLEPNRPTEEVKRDVNAVASSNANHPDNTGSDKGDRAATETTEQTASQSLPDSTINEQVKQQLQDLVELEPTSNAELQDAWNFQSGSEVHQYLESSLKEYYYRDEDSYIRATEKARQVAEDTDRGEDDGGTSDILKEIESEFNWD